MLSDKWFRGSIFESLVGGNLLVLGMWYLNRPFLLENFPNVAADAASMGLGGFGGKLVILSLSSVIAAIILSHLVDVVIPVMIGDGRYINKRHGFLKKVLVRILWLFHFSRDTDPRIKAVERYIESNRKVWFLEMADQWCAANEDTLKEESEKIHLHQHVTSRLRVISEMSREVMRDVYSGVAFSGALFTALLVLIPVGFLSIFLNASVVGVKTQRAIDVGVLIVLIYVSAVGMGFLFRRGLRTYYSQVLTLGMHYFDISRKEKAHPVA